MIRELGLLRDEILEPLENASKVSGFQSPAEDYEKVRLNIMQMVVRDPINTFYFEMDQTLAHLGLQRGDLLVVDKSILARSGHLVVAFIDQKWSVIKIESDKPKGQDESVLIFGVVTWHFTPHL